MISIINKSSSFKQLLDVVKKIKNSNVAQEADPFEVYATQLCSIHLVGNRIKIVDDLFNHLITTSLNSLRECNISFNSLQDIPSLSSFQQLTILDISHNRVESLSFISELTALKVLRCHCNSIYSLLPLYKSRLQNTLVELWISDNHIEWQQFSYLLEYNTLQVLICDQNPSDAKPKILEFLSKVLPSLSFLNGQHIRQHDNSNNNIKILPKTKEEENGTLTTDFKVIMTQLKAFIRQQEFSASNLATVSNNDSPDHGKTLQKQVFKSRLRLRQRLNSTGSSENEEAMTSTTNKHSLSRSSSTQSIISDSDLAVVGTSKKATTTSRTTKLGKTQSAPPRSRPVVNENGTGQHSTIVVSSAEVNDAVNDALIFKSESSDQAAGSAVKLLKQRKAGRKMATRTHSTNNDTNSHIDLASLNANLDQMLSDMRMMKGAQQPPASTNTNANKT